MPNIISKSLSSLSFNDVVNFVSYKRRNTVHLDYINNLLNPELPKRIAAMANTYGGLIIIGVTIDEQTGKPKSWRGIAYNDNLLPHTTDIISEVTPCPRYEVHQTDEHNGRVFILIHVFEGSDGPYFASIDPHTVWLRSGLLNSPLEEADRNSISKIIDRKNDSYYRREKNKQHSDHIFSELLKEAIVKSKTARHPDDGQSVYAPTIENKKVFLKLHIQPVDPMDGLIDTKPVLLSGWLPLFRIEHENQIYTAHFPELIVEPVPNGTASFNVYNNGHYSDVRSDQFYVNGSVLHVHNALQYSGAEHIVYMSLIATEIFDFLESTAKFYENFGYNGTLSFSVNMEGVKGHPFMPIMIRGNSEIASNIRYMLIDSYSWQFELSTIQISNKLTLISLFHEILERLHWDLRVHDYSKELVDSFLEDIGRITSRQPSNRHFTN